MVLYRFLADLVVVLHAAYVAFVILGLAAVWVGILLRWDWVRNFWFRAVHLAAILFVCLEAIAGIVCPLTTLESYLRERSGEVRYSGDFIGYWAHELLFVDAPQWVLTICYIAFGLVVAATFVFAPPRWPWRHAARGRG
jgi:hypothetical protein